MTEHVERVGIFWQGCQPFYKLRFYIDGMAMFPLEKYWLKHVVGFGNQFKKKVPKPMRKGEGMLDRCN